MCHAWSGQRIKKGPHMKTAVASMGLCLLTGAMPESNHEAAVAEFIRKQGITRCPTACVLPTQGSIAAADRAALAEYAMARDRVRQVKVAAHTQFRAADGHRQYRNDHLSFAEASASVAE
jgi:hypothetical protein